MSITNSTSVPSEQQSKNMLAAIGALPSSGGSGGSGGAFAAVGSGGSGGAFRTVGSGGSGGSGGAASSVGSNISLNQAQVILNELSATIMHQQANELPRISDVQLHQTTFLTIQVLNSLLTNPNFDSVREDLNALKKSMNNSLGRPFDIIEKNYWGIPDTTLTQIRKIQQIVSLIIPPATPPSNNAPKKIPEEVTQLKRTDPNACETLKKLATAVSKSENLRELLPFLEENTPDKIWNKISTLLLSKFLTHELELEEEIPYLFLSTEDEVNTLQNYISEVAFEHETEYNLIDQLIGKAAKSKKSSENEVKCWEFFEKIITLSKPTEEAKIKSFQVVFCHFLRELASPSLSKKGSSASSEEASKQQMNEKMKNDSAPVSQRPQDDEETSIIEGIIEDFYRGRFDAALLKATHLRNNQFVNAIAEEVEKIKKNLSYSPCIESIIGKYFDERWAKSAFIRETLQKHSSATNIKTIAQKIDALNESANPDVNKLIGLFKLSENRDEITLATIKKMVENWQFGAMFFSGEMSDLEKTQGFLKSLSNRTGIATLDLFNKALLKIMREHEIQIAEETIREFTKVLNSLVL